MTSNHLRGANVRLLIAMLLSIGVLLIVWLGTHQPSFRLVTHRVLPYNSELIAPYGNGYPRIEAAKDTSFLFNRFCWLAMDGKRTGEWLTFPSTRQISLSASGVYVAALTTDNKIFWSKQNGHLYTINHVSIDPHRPDFTPYPVIASDGTIYGSLSENYHIPSRKPISIPAGWELQPYTLCPILVASPYHILLHKRGTGRNDSQIQSVYGLYDCAHQRILWSHKLSARVFSNGAFGAVFIDGDRSVLVVSEEAAIFEGTTYRGSFDASTHARITTSLASGTGRWHFSEDGSVWVEEGPRVHILNWRRGNTGLRTISIFSTANSLRQTSTLMAVAKDGKFIAQVCPKKIQVHRTSQFQEPDPRQTTWMRIMHAVKRVVSPDQGETHQTLILSMTLFIDGKASNTFTQNVSEENTIDEMLNCPLNYLYSDRLAFSPDARYLSWETRIVNSSGTFRDYYVFRIRRASLVKW